jgi:beta-galactosidase
MMLVLAFIPARSKLTYPSIMIYPLSLVFTDNSSITTPYRVRLYVNGYQFGKFMPHIGPPTEFHIPQGILTYRGENWAALTLWGQTTDGAKLGGLRLTNFRPVRSALTEIVSSEQPIYKKRVGAY